MKNLNKTEAELNDIIAGLKLQHIELELQNTVLRREKEEAVAALAERNDFLAKLNRFSIEVSDLPSMNDIEILIARRLKELTGCIVATFSDFNSERQSLFARHVEIEPGIIEKIVAILGSQISKMEIRLSDEAVHELSTELIGRRKTLHEISFGNIPKQVGAAIQTLLGIDRFIGVAFHSEGRLYGTAMLALGKNTPDPHREAIEDFTSLASLALRRKKAEQLLVESEEMYQIFIDSTVDMAYLKDENLRYVMINRANAQFFGKKKEEIIGLSDFDFMDHRSAGYCRTTDKKALDERKIVISEEIVGDRIYETRKFPVRLVSGLTGVGGYIRDITAHRTAVLALVESENRYRRITEGLTDYLYTVIVKKGKVVETLHNDVCKTVTGYTPDDFRNDPYLWINMVVPEDRQTVAERFQKILKGEDLPPTEHRIICKDGSIRWISDTTIPKFDSNGNLVSYDGVIKEITGRKMAEEIIRYKNEELIKVNAEKDKFFSIIAHDLRSPFNTFLGFTQMMAEEIETLSLPEIQTIAVSMRNSATNLFQLLENLLEWSMFQRGITSFNPEMLNVKAKISDSLFAIFESAAKKGIMIQIEVDDELEVYADGNMFESIIRNLTINAVKFSNPGGLVIISALQKDLSFTEFLVKDSGIGMSEKILKNLFRIDENTNRQGTGGEPSTGLGLIICREFVERHGGSIRVTSSESSGSEFRFTLPSVKNN